MRVLLNVKKYVAPIKRKKLNPNVGFQGASAHLFLHT